MALALAVILFLGFVGNVTLNALGGGSVLSDVQEMLLLLAASICFVVAILRREAAASEDNK